MYHFTSHEFYPRIEREGLSKGGVPTALVPDGQGGTKVRMMKGVQWLTIDPEFDTQTWATLSTGIVGSMIRKNDWRITIDIPNLALFRLYTWQEFAARHRLPYADACNNHPMLGKRQTQFWRVYGGHIPTGWFVEMLQNPTLRNLVQDFPN